METIVIVGANNLHKYNWDELIKLNIKFFIISGEHTKNAQAEIINKYTLEHYCVATEPFPDPAVELLGKESIAQACKKIMQIDSNIIIYTDDEKYLIQVAQVREELNIANSDVETAMRFRDKLLMRDVLKKAGVELPKYMYLPKEKKYSYNELKELFDNKNFVIKPNLLAGSFGFHSIRTEEDYEKAMVQLSGLPDEVSLMAEAFMVGELFHYDAIIYEGKIFFPLLCEYAFPIGSYKDGYINCSLLTSSRIKKHKKISEYCVEIVTKLRPSDGSIHLEIFYDEMTDIVSFLEIANRPAGAHTCSLYERNFNFNIFQYSLLSVCKHISQETIKQIEAKLDKQENYIFNGYIPSRNGNLSIFNFPNLKGKLSIRPFKKYKEYMYDPLSVGDSCAYFEIENSTYDNQIEDFLAMKKSSLSLLKTI